MATKKMTPSQKYHTHKINRAEYEAAMNRRTKPKTKTVKAKKPKKAQRCKATKRVLGKKMK